MLRLRPQLDRHTGSSAVPTPRRRCSGPASLCPVVESAKGDSVEQHLPQELLAVAYQATASGVAETLAEGRSPQKAVEATQNAARQLDALLRPLDQAHPPACRAGCSWCCHVRVACTPIEAIAVAAFVQSGIDKRARRKLVERLRAVLDQARGLDSKAWARQRLPCPFLGEGGLCQVHSARPLACRGWHSFDVAQCKRHFEDPVNTIEASGERLTLRGIASRALGDGLRRAGLDASGVDLASAVRLILDKPDTVDSWLRGEDAFAAARWQG